MTRKTLDSLEGLICSIIVFEFICLYLKCLSRHCDILNRKIMAICTAQLFVNTPMIYFMDILNHKISFSIKSCDLNASAMSSFAI